MTRAFQLLFALGWLGACLIGSLTGSFVASTRPALLVGSLIAIGWISGGRWLAQRLLAPPHAWLFVWLLFSAFAVPPLAAHAALVLSSVVTDRATAISWAGGLGAALGLVTSLMLRPVLTRRDRRRWLLIMTSWGTLVLLLAVAVTHPLPTFVPDRMAALRVGLIVGSGWGLVPGGVLAALLKRRDPSVDARSTHQATRPRSVGEVWGRRIGVVTLVAGISGTLYAERCQLLPCPAATWQDLVVLADGEATHAGAGYAVGRLQAEPTFRTSYTADGPVEITMWVDIVATTPTAADPGMYDWHRIELTDRDLRRRRISSGTTSESPTPAAVQRLQRVRIGPRDVYRITWAAAQRTLAPATPVSAAPMSLYTDTLPTERFGIESAWVISYAAARRVLTYWVDAQTGAIVTHTIE